MDQVNRIDFDLCQRVVWHIITTKPPGGILVFMPGVHDFYLHIRTTHQHPHTRHTYTHIGGRNRPSLPRPRPDRRRQRSGHIHTHMHTNSRVDTYIYTYTPPSTPTPKHTHIKTRHAPHTTRTGIDANNLWLVPLHGALTTAKQQRVFSRPPKGVHKVHAVVISVITNFLRNHRKYP